MSSPIVLVAPQRSGSTVLQKTLAQSGSVEAYGEVFHENSGGYAPNFFNFLASNAEASSLYTYPSSKNVKRLFDIYLEFLSSSTAKRFFLVDAKENSLHHFDAIWSDRFECPVFLRLCMEARLPIIRLKRKNIFLQVLSQDVVNASGVGHVAPAEDPPKVAITVNCFEYEQRIRRFITEGKFIDRFLAVYDRTVKFWYEDLFDGPRINGKCLRRLSSLIGEQFNEKQLLAFRKSIESPADLISNQEEVTAYFKRTPYSPMVQSAMEAGRAS